MALGRRESRRSLGAVQYGVPGDSRQRRVEWRQPTARPRQPQAVRGAVSPLAGSGSARRQCHQRRPRSHVGFGRRRCAMGKGLWRGALAGISGVCGRADPVPGRSRDLGAAVQRPQKARRVYARETAAQRAYQGAAPEEIVEAGEVFDPGWLTIGFARRFAEYKRPHLLLHDPERLLRILTNPQRPVQLLLAGKAHPEDAVGQGLIKQWHDFLRRPEARRHAVFLADYDMLLTQQLVSGVDLWLNTPRRPWEACGTSGMKVLANGGLNFSELDGWWVEAYAPDVGWAIGDARDRGADTGLGRGRSGLAIFVAGKRDNRTLLRAGRTRHSARLGGADSRKHGAPNAGILGEPRRPAVRRGALPAAGAGLLRPRRERRGRRVRARGLETKNGGAMAGGAIRGSRGRPDRSRSMPSRFRFISGRSIPATCRWRSTRIIRPPRRLFGWDDPG